MTQFSKMGLDFALYGVLLAGALLCRVAESDGGNVPATRGSNNSRTKVLRTAYKSHTKPQRHEGGMR